MRWTISAGGLRRGKVRASHNQIAFQGRRKFPATDAGEVGLCHDEKGSDELIALVHGNPQEFNRKVLVPLGEWVGWMKFKTIKQTVLLDATPDEVYEAYVDPRKHSEFTGSPATGSPRVGGRFTAWDGYISGRFLELEKGKKAVHEWKTTKWPAGYPPSLVELTLKLKGKKTELTMVHSMVPAEQAGDYAEGWTDYYWEPLKKYFWTGRQG